LIEYPYNLIGIVFIAIGIYFILKPWYLFQKHNTPEDFSESTVLVQEGIYRYSRNPMYLGGVLFLLGLGVTT
jgi:protein-S-isoprenylcysteine O-methyltransferase Ste14